jgi:hypothetical protein
MENYSIEKALGKKFSNEVDCNSYYARGDAKGDVLR